MVRSCGGILSRPAAILRAVAAIVVLVAVTPAPAVALPFLTAADVMAAVQTAATAVSLDTMVIAVVDREGIPLAVFRKPSAPTTVPTTANPAPQTSSGERVIPKFGVAANANDYAVALARTGAFFSNNQAPLSSRTVRFISGIHFPPGFTNQPPAALYGIENTNRGCSFNAVFNPGQDVARATSINGLPCGAGAGTAGCGIGIATGKKDIFDSDANAVDGGGVPIFKNGILVGGIGVTGIERATAEFAAFVGSLPGPGFGPVAADPGVIFLNGIQLPFVVNTVRPAGLGPGPFVGSFVIAPIDSPKGPAGVPEGYLIGPLASAELSAADVNTIIQRGVAEANKTRAAIRLPLGSTTRMVLSVSDLAGNILGLFRMPDATIFSIDVSVAKARNAVYFSSLTRDPRDISGVPPGTSVTARTIGFGAMPLYPPGIDGTRPGPFFGDFVTDIAKPCTQGFEPANANQSGIVFFPGSIGLYRGGFQLVGGLGVSGDGVEQDDFVTAAAVTPDFVPAISIRADNIVIGGVRLPYFKFPRNPEVQ